MCPAVVATSGPPNVPGVGDSSRHLPLVRFTATNTKHKKGGTRCVCVDTHRPGHTNGRHTQDGRATVHGPGCRCACGASVQAHLHPGFGVMHICGRGHVGWAQRTAFAKHSRLRPLRPCERAGSVRVPAQPGAAWRPCPRPSFHMRSHTCAHGQLQVQTHVGMQQPHRHRPQARNHHVHM